MPADFARFPFVAMSVKAPTHRTAWGLLALISLGHFLNDAIQSIIPAALPILRDNLSLTFAEVGLITLVIQITSSLLQPAVGWFTDRRPSPWSLPAGMFFTLVGLVVLGGASTLTVVLAAVALIGCGSAVFHPESARIAQFASGGRKGLAQSVFQVGGNAGMALGPLAAAFVILPFGQISIAWFALPAFLTALLLARVGRLATPVRSPCNIGCANPTGKSLRSLIGLLSLLMLLMFSKQAYVCTLQNFFTFYLIDNFGMDMAGAQYALFGFLAMCALGTVAGGPLTDRFGPRAVILVSILGAAPFALALPWMEVSGVIVLALLVAFITSSAFSAILVCAIDAAPTHVGLLAGLFFGLSFGMGGLATAAFGLAADQWGLQSMLAVTSTLPLIGASAFWLPADKPRHA